MVIRRNTNDDPEPYPVPNPEWTNKQHEYWEQDGKPIYERLETEAGKYWYRRTWRPKKVNVDGTSGMMQRNHVKLGTPEDYIVEHVQSALNPWGNFTSTMMRRIARYSVDRDELDEAVDDILSARLERLKNINPDGFRQLVADSAEVAELYGVTSE